MARKRTKSQLPPSGKRGRKRAITTRISSRTESDVNRLFGRIGEILAQSRANVVRSVNSQMVLAYWHIGREIVQVLQGGDDRAVYGRKVLESLSQRLGACPTLRNLSHDPRC